MTPSDLGRQVKSKYPGVYDIYPDEVVGQRTLVKYPQYQSMIDDSLYDQGKTAALTGIKTATTRPELQPITSAIPDLPSDPVSGAVDAAGKTLSFPIRVGATLEAGPDVVGQAASEGMGAAGHPEAGATLGTAISMAPLLAGGASAIKAMETSSAPLAKVLRGPKALSPEYAFQDKIAGISGDLPVRSGKLPGFEESSADIGDAETAKNLNLNPPVSYPKDPAAFLNFARARITAYGNDLSVQELTDYKKALKGMISAGPSWLNKHAGDGAYAIASDLNNQVAARQAAGITNAMQGMEIPEGYEPTRESLNELYKWALRTHPDVAGMVKSIWNYIGPKMRWGVIGVP